MRLPTLDAVKREQAKRHLYNFLAIDGEPNWIDGPHLRHLAAKLEAVERGEIKRLAVFMPPRHGKSETVSKKFPAWFLGRNPNKEVILTSYASDLAYDFSRIARETLREWGPKLWGVDIAPESSAVGRWGIAGTRGGLVAAGVGGPITGRGADLAVIDDPFKNWQEAASETVRTAVREWYRSTLRTRLAPNGAIVLVQTRWHQDDLAGWLIAEAEAEGEKWEIVNFPAIAEEDDCLGRKPGEALWPARYPLSELEAIKQAVGSYLWAALYQQSPRPAEGLIFKRDWFRFYDSPPERFDTQIQSWDTSFKDAKSSSYVVGGLWGKLGANYYLLDLVRAQLDFPATCAALISFSKRHPRATAKLIEDTANGPAVIASLRNQISGLVAIKAEKSKEARAAAVTPLFEAGNVYLPRYAPWIGDYIEELCTFPQGAHDDQVDMTSQALIRLSGGGPAFIAASRSGAERERKVL